MLIKYVGCERYFEAIRAFIVDTHSVHQVNENNRTIAIDELELADDELDDLKKLCEIAGCEIIEYKTETQLDSDEANAQVRELQAENNRLKAVRKRGLQADATTIAAAMIRAGATTGTGANALATDAVNVARIIHDRIAEVSGS